MRSVGRFVSRERCLIFRSSLLLHASKCLADSSRLKLRGEFWALEVPAEDASVLLAHTRAALHSALKRS